MRRKKAKKMRYFQIQSLTMVSNKFVNNLMLDGKKSFAFKIFYDAIDMVEKE